MKRAIEGDLGSVLLAYMLLVVCVGFFGGLSAFFILRSQKEAEKHQDQNRGITKDSFA